MLKRVTLIYKTGILLPMVRIFVDWDSSVGIATDYGLDGPGIESRSGMRFSAPVQTGPGDHPASYTVGTGSFPGVNRLGSGLDHPPLSSVEVKERVELYLYSASGPSWPVLGQNLPFMVRVFSRKGKSGLN